jgi:hypothetical protein
MSKQVLSDSKTITASQFDYSIKTTSGPIVKPQQFLPRTSDTVTVTTQNQDLYVDIPAYTPLYPYDSWVEMTGTVAGNTTATVGTFIYADNHPFMANDWKTSNGVDLAINNSLNIYSKATNKIKYTVEMMQANDEVEEYKYDGATPPSSLVSVTGLSPVGNGTVAFPGSTAALTTSGTSLQDAPRYGYAITNAGITQGISIRYRIPFHLLGEGLFGVNKCVMLPVNSTIRLNLGTIDQFGYITTSGTNFARSASLASLTVSSVRLMLAVETNSAVIQGIRGQLAAGGFKIPHRWYFSQTQPNTGTQHSLAFRTNSSYGSHLLRNIWVASTAPGTGLVYNLSRPSTMSSYFTQMNNENIQKQQINTGANTWDDWAHNKLVLKGSVVKNKDIYSRDWVHIDDFSGESPLLTRYVDESSSIGGIALPASGGDVTLALTANMSSSTTISWFSFPIVNRYLNISDKAVSVTSY